MAVLLSAMLASVSCSGIEVSSEHLDGTRYGAYKTWLWLPDSEPADHARTQGVSDFVLDRIQQAIHDELQAKGLVNVSAKDAAKADLFVTSSISISRDLELNDPYFAYDRTRVVEMGTLMIDLIDAKTKKLVWSGRGKTRIGSYPTLEEREARVKQVVQAILAQYPPRT